MVKTIITYTAILVGAYLVLAHATGFGESIKAGAAGYSSAVKTLQGR